MINGYELSSKNNQLIVLKLFKPDLLLPFGINSVIMVINNK